MTWHCFEKILDDEIDKHRHGITGSLIINKLIEYIDLEIDANYYIIDGKMITAKQEEERKKSLIMLKHLIKRK